MNGVSQAFEEIKGEEHAAPPFHPQTPPCAKWVTCKGG
jgi:hypothetical protein